MAGLDTSFDTTMDKVVKQIYSHCDPENTDLVPVSILIEFVKQFMPENIEETEDLRNQLDPEGNDPRISSYTFSQVIESWASNLKEKYSEDSDITMDHKGMRNDDLAFNQSTPRSSLGYQQLVKNCTELFNLSNISTYATSNGMNSTVDANNSSTLENEIRELQHQLHKLKSELDLSKQQLAATEEQNEYLQMDLNKMTQIHKSEFDLLLEKIKESKLENEHQKEEAFDLRLQIKHLEKENLILTKEKETIQNECDNLEREKMNLERKLETVKKREDICKAECEELRNELRERDAELSALNKVTDDLKHQLDNQKDLVSFYTNENAIAKQKTFAAERLYEEVLAEKQENNILNEIIQETDTPLERYSTFQCLYNSPRFLSQISNPGDPVFDDDLISSENTSCTLFKSVLCKSCSTPVTTEKTFDFDDLPGCPLLSPVEKYDVTKCSSAFVFHVENNAPTPLYVVERPPDELSMLSRRGASGDNCSTRKLRSPQKKVKDEICAMLKMRENINTQTYFQDTVSLVELKKLLRDQEDIKKNLWEGIRNLRDELDKYKIKYEELSKLFLNKEKEVKDCNMKYEKALDDLRSEQLINKKITAELSEYLKARINLVHCCVQTDESGSHIEKIKEKLADLQTEKTYQRKFKTNLEKLWAENTTTIGKCEKFVMSIYNKLCKFVSAKEMDDTFELYRALTHLDKLVEAITNQLKLYENKKTSFAKQQLKIERLLEKVDELNTELSRERNIKANLFTKIQGNEVLLKDTKRTYETQITELKLTIQNLEKESIKYKDDMRKLKEELEIVRNEAGNHREKFEITLRDLISEKCTSNNLNQEVQSLISVKKQLENDIEVRLKLQVNDNMKIQKLDKDLKERDEQISKLMTQIKMEDVVSFITASNTELRRTTSNILNRVKSQLRVQSNALLVIEDHAVISSYSSLEEEMNNLGNNIKLAMQLLETMAEQYNSLWVGELKNGSSMEKLLINLSSPLKDDENSPRQRLTDKFNLSVPRPGSSNFGSVVQYSVKCLVTVIFVWAFLLCYAQWECYKDGQLKACPLDSLIDKIIEKRYTGVI